MQHEYGQAEHSEVREVLEGSWRQLVASLQELLAGPHGEAPETRSERFAELEQRLRGHMRIEDDVMLRPFELHDPREASALRADYRELRLLLDEVAEELAAGSTKGPRALTLLRLLDVHSKRKLMRLFPWVDSRLRRHAKMTIVDRVRALSGARRSMVEVMSLSELDEPLASWA